MRKGTINFWVDFASFLLLLGIAATGLIMEFVLPPGSGGRSLWGLGRHAWGDLHFWMAVGMAALITLHLALHWGWTLATIRRLAPRRAGPPRRGPRDRLWGVLVLTGTLSVLAAFVLIGRSQVVTPPDADAAHDEHAALEVGPTE